MRRIEPLPRAFQAPVDVHASADGQVYMFQGRIADSGGSSDEEQELNMMELRPRGHDFEEREREKPGELLLLERDVSQGDNLNKLALQYGCKVMDIKRLNNLIQDQDLYALKSIKIPVRKHGLLTETNTEFREPDMERLAQSPIPDHLPHSTTGSTLGGSSNRPHVQEYTDFLKGVDDDMERLIQTTEEEFLVNQQQTPRRWGVRGQRLNDNQGSDWGIQWWNAVVAMLLIGIVLPIFYVVYFKTQNSGSTASMAVADDDGSANLSLTTSNNSLEVISSLSFVGSLMNNFRQP